MAARGRRAEQIVAVLLQAESDVLVNEICRPVGINEKHSLDEAIGRRTNEGSHG